MCVLINRDLATETTGVPRGLPGHLADLAMILLKGFDSLFPTRPKLGRALNFACCGMNGSWPRVPRDQQHL